MTLDAVVTPDLIRGLWRGGAWSRAAPARGWGDVIIPRHPGLDPGSLAVKLCAMEKGGYVYILANKPHGLIYVGVTADMVERYWQHRNGFGSKYCRKWGIDRLVWYEYIPDIYDAIAHEKRVKRWVRP